MNYIYHPYDKTVKQNLPLYITELLDLGAEFSSIEQPRIPEALYLSHLMTKIIDIAEGDLLSLLKNRCHLRILLTYPTQFHDITILLW